MAEQIIINRPTSDGVDTYILSSITFSEEVKLKTAERKKQEQLLVDKTFRYLSTLGKLRKREKELSSRLFHYGVELDHECIKTGSSVSQLQRFFDCWKPLSHEHGEEYVPLQAIKTLQSFAKYMGEEVCPQCKLVMDAIEERKSTRRSIRAIRGHLSRIADEVVEGETN